MRKQATTARFLCLDSSFCQTHFFDRRGCSTCTDQKESLQLCAARPPTPLGEEATADLLQVEDGSRDPLDAVEDLLRVRRPLESQSSVSVEVQLPPDSGILRLARRQMKNTP